MKRGVDEQVIDLGVGIDKDQGASLGCARPRISGRSNLLEGYVQHPGMVGEGDLAGIVGGAVIHHQDLIVLAAPGSRLVDRGDGGAEKLGFVMGGDDEGNHGRGAAGESDQQITF